MKNTVLSGIRATGKLHLGNYLGAVKGMLELQDNPDYETFYMVADLHTITTPYSVENLRRDRREIIIDYLAAGLDPKKSTLFLQADVPEHTELMFYLLSAATIARMSHLPTYKEKVKQYPKENTMALLNYPILMAADILVYKANKVPVGVDQEPHLEVAREIARKMNDKYGTNFPEPTRFATKGEYIPSLRGEGKMSKSVEGSFINLTDEKNIIFKKVLSIPTASVSGGEFNSGLKALFALTKIFLPTKYDEYLKRYESKELMFAQLKNRLADAIYDELKSFQTKRSEIEKDSSYVDSVIKEGAEKARVVASKTVKEVREKMGLSS